MNSKKDIQVLVENFTGSLIAMLHASYMQAIKAHVSSLYGEVGEASEVGRLFLADTDRDAILAANHEGKFEAPRIRARLAAKPAKKAKDANRRLARRSPEELSKLEDAIVKLVAKHPDGMRAEAIREKLDLLAKELPKPLGALLDARRLRKKGEKRATTYFATKKG